MSRNFRLAAAAISAVSVAGLSFSSAFAAPADSTIDSSKTTTLTIHKYEGPANTSAECVPTGQPVPETCLTDKVALDGAVFDIYKVMDLKTNEDWIAAEAAYNSGTYDITNLEPVASVTTANGGVATFTGEVALYYVFESKTPEGYTGSSPFFITLPMTDPTDAAWDYDLDVYPKNDKTEMPHKAVIDADSLKAGDTIKYEVKTSIPNYGDVVGAPDTDGKYTAPDGKYDHNDLQYFVIADTFPAELTGPAVESVTLDGVALTATTDYTVNTMVNYVEVVFTEAGLDKLAAAAATGEVKVNYSATVDSIPTDGIIENEAWTVPAPKPSQGSTPGEYMPPTTPPETPPTDTPTNKVRSQFLPVTFTKLAGDTDAALAGVTFDIYKATLVKNADGTITTSCEGDLGTAVQTGITSGADGTVTSAPLRVSTWYNDALIEDPAGRNDGHLDGAQYADLNGYQNYCLVETESADGYQLLAKPIEFTLQDTLRDTTLSPFVTAWVKALDQNTELAGNQVYNQPDNINNELPLTGGQGTALLSLAGLALVAGGAGYYFVSNRRREEAQN